MEKRKFLKEIRAEFLPGICVINLKKSSGGNTTNTMELREIAHQDQKNLDKQFKLYYANEKTRPDFIICESKVTSSAFNKLVDIPNKENWLKTARGIEYFRYDTNKYLISYPHPEARVQDCLLYYGLIDAIKEISST